jgi:alpha-glucuronidase
VIDGSLEGHANSAMVGVSNIGDDRNWTGAQFSQADWYGFGRLAWDPKLSPEQIAREWLGMTFTDDPAFANAMVPMMMESREAVVNYMTPLGLAHLMATGHHYGPGPWVSDLPRPEQNPVYFHRADAMGLGFDRTPSGSDATSQYAPPIAKLFAGSDIPDRYLLWFHHVAWDHKMKSGRTLWDELVLHYDEGIGTVRQMRQTWDAMKPYVDAERWSQTAAFLAIQQKEAQWWRDACIAYFETFSHMAMPAGHAAPPHDLAFYKGVYIPYAPGRPGYTAAPFRNTPNTVYSSRAGRIRHASQDLFVCRCGAGPVGSGGIFGDQAGGAQRTADLPAQSALARGRAEETTQISAGPLAGPGTENLSYAARLSSAVGGVRAPDQGSDPGGIRR